ncbi:MAG: hypothetical protein ACREC6_05760, partial [Hyphomicrobiaceae bacterium]
MTFFRRVPIDTEATQAAGHAVLGLEGGRLAAVISAVALLFSAYGLWETSLKAADIKVYVTDTISYTRDPWGSYEVLVVPLTISNGGARDSAVVALRLEAKNIATGQIERFESAYTVDATYFGANDNVATRVKRPKMPFAPLSIAGRAAWSGTILFYPPEYRAQKLVEPKSKIVMTLKLVTPDASGWLDRVLGDPPVPITLMLDVPDFMHGAL